MLQFMRSFARLSTVLQSRWRSLGIALVGAAVGLMERRAGPTDYFLFSRAGAHIWAGSLDVYKDAAIQAGPLQLLLAGAIKSTGFAGAGADVVTLHVVGTALMALWLVV